MRKAIGLLVVLTSVLFFALALASPASADPNAPGNNGTVKVVNDGDDPIGADDADNDPHVCHFHLFGFHFDSNSTGTWKIESWPPTGDRSVVASGTWTANASGRWAVPGPSLANGHYKVFAKQNGSPGDDKHKVFWVKCPPSSGPQAPNQNVQSGQNAQSGQGLAPTQLGVQQAPAGRVMPIVEVPPTNQNAVAGVENLPSTSTAGLPLAGAGLALVAAGAAVLRRKR